jgi:hypothetical protein
MEDFERKIPDGVMCDVPVQAEVEKAYRRGFHQGAAAFLLALQEGAADSEMRVWLERLFTWRLKTAKWVAGHTVKPVHPPVAPPFPRSKKHGVRAWRRVLGG